MLLLVEPERSPRQRWFSFGVGLMLNLILAALLVSVRFTAWQPRPGASPTNAILIAPPPVQGKPRMTAVPRPVRRLQLPPPGPRIRVPSAPELPPVLRSEALPAPPPRPLPAPPPAVLNGSFPSTTALVAHTTPVRPQAAETGSFSATLTGVAPGAAGRALAMPAGFGAASSASPSPAAVRGSAALMPSGFETAALPPPKQRALAVVPSGAFQSLEILNKPKPDYTEEARRKRVEGEVWLEVLFAADGTPRVQRVLRSLGFGLDETAVRSAQQIRFRPAREGARDVDQVATVRVQFQLAE